MATHRFEDKLVPGEKRKVALPHGLFVAIEALGKKELREREVGLKLLDMALERFELVDEEEMVGTPIQASSAMCVGGLVVGQLSKVSGVRENFRVRVGGTEISGLGADEAIDKLRSLCSGDPTMVGYVFDDSDYSALPDWWNLGEGDTVETDVGAGTVVDGLCAGACWQKVRFTSGPAEGREVNLRLGSPPSLATYVPTVLDDDGFMVNGDDFPGDLPWENELEVALLSYKKADPPEVAFDF